MLRRKPCIWSTRCRTTEMPSSLTPKSSRRSRMSCARAKSTSANSQLRLGLRRNQPAGLDPGFQQVLLERVRIRNSCTEIIQASRCWRGFWLCPACQRRANSSISGSSCCGRTILSVTYSSPWVLSLRSRLCRAIVAPCRCSRLWARSCAPVRSASAHRAWLRAPLPAG